MTFDESSLRVTLTLDPPLPIRKLVADWRLVRPYAVSGDVHQRSWSVHTWTADLEDPHNTRIATELPRFGRWQVEAQLATRPAGTLPSVVAGASPAYDLRDSDEFVTAITIRPAT